MEKNIKSGTIELAEELKVKLQHGKVHFWFLKDNGEEREAYGTLKLSDIPEDKHPKGTGKSSPFVIVFFDLEKEAWRSCKNTSIIAIDPNYDGRSTLI